MEPYRHFKTIVGWTETNRLSLQRNASGIGTWLKGIQQRYQQGAFGLSAGLISRPLFEHGPRLW